MVLITGATGTNGLELIKLLARQGIRVRAWFGRRSVFARDYPPEFR